MPEPKVSHGLGILLWYITIDEFDACSNGEISKRELWQRADRRREVIGDMRE